MVDINSMVRVTDDSEMQMAKSDLYNLAKNSVELYKIIKDLSELEGWTQAKITKAADYIGSVLNYMKYESRDQMNAINESASAGGTSSGAIATAPMPLSKKKKKVIKRVQEEGKAGLKTWEVSYDDGPHQSSIIIVRAANEEEAKIKAKKKAGRRAMINYAKLIKNPPKNSISEEVWDKPNPVKKHSKLSPAQKAKAKARAKKAGRKYPNMVDNIWAAKN